MARKRKAGNPKSENGAHPAELRAEECGLRQVFDNLPDTVLVYSIADDGRIILEDINSAAEKIGTATKKDIGKSIEELYPADVLDWSKKIYNECITSGDSISIDNHLIEVSGQPCYVTVTFVPIKNDKDVVSKIVVRTSDVTNLKRAEQERAAALNFFESMDRINRAIQSAQDFKQMMSDVLDEVLSIFDCDRAFLLYPCDPESPVWSVPMERTKPGYPSAMEIDIEMPINPDIAAAFKVLLNTDGPVIFGPESDYPLSVDFAERFDIKSILGMALNPKVGKPWQFGLHQCSYPRVWTQEEMSLFKEIGRRLQDGLTSLLAYSDLRESKTRYESLFDKASDGVCLLSMDGEIISINQAFAKMHGYEKTELAEIKQSTMIAPEALITPESEKQVRNVYSRLLDGDSVTFEIKNHHKNGNIIPLEVSSSIIETPNESYVQAFVRDISNRKKTEKALKDANAELEEHRTHLEALVEERTQELRQALDSSEKLMFIVPIAIFTVDSEYKITSWNRMMEEITGYDKDEAIGEKYGLLFDDSEVDKAFLYSNDAFKTSLKKEYTIRTKNGKKRIVAVNSDSILDSNGNKTGGIWAFEDITQRKLLERKLVMANKALENAQEGIEIIEENGNFVYVNSGECRSLGYTKEELLQMGVPDIDPYWNDEKWPEIWKATTEADMLTFEAEHKRKDGSIFPIEVITNHFTYEGQIYAVALTRDITERKKEEEKARKHEETLAIAMKTANMADWDLDLATMTQNLNDRFYDLIRTNAEKEGGYVMPIDEYFRRYLLPEDAMRILEILKESDPANPNSNREYENREYEHRIKRGDGSQGFVTVKLRTLFDDQSKPVKLLGTTQDITERKLAEEELKKAREDADKANQAKSMFLANMSHELRTPLNAILGFTQLMNRDESIPESARKNLGIINRSGEHLLSMINDVLDLSKIEAGKTELKEESFGLIEMIEDIGEMLKSRAQAKSLKVVVDLDSSLERCVRADLGKIRQILINLMGNAVKFTDTGGIALRARMKKLDKKEEARPENDQMKLEVEVQDTGSGISEEKLNSIFTPFAQVGSIKASQMGTGLGLTISQSFAILMKGKITVESKEGKGSIFKLQVPVSLDAEISVAADKTEPLLPVGISKGEPEWKILVVEDNLENALLIDNILTHVGLKVRIAGNGKEGVEIADEWQPHLIFMDMRMPIMDGMAATKAIKKTPWGKDLKIIAFTASVFSEQKDNILNGGCDDILHKPFRDWEPFDILAQHLGVRFRYPGGGVEPKSTKKKSETIKEISLKDIKKTSKETVASIRKAAIELDKATIITIAADLQKDHSMVAEFLKRKAESFDFESIEKMFTVGGKDIKSRRKAS